MALRRRATVRAGAAVLAAALAGCAANPGGVRTATLTRTVDLADAFIVPPPGGPSIVAVTQNEFANGLSQVIVLQNRTGAPGQNAITVRAYGPMGRDRGIGRLAEDVPNAATIARELASRFPGVPMQVSGLFAQNRYGPFGYATGSRGGVNCLYAWQRIAAEPGVFAANRGAITWRLRLCDRRASPRDLLLVAYGLTIAGYFMSERWNPYGDPPGVDPRLGVPGESVLPQQAVDETVIAPNAFAQEPVRQAAPRRRRRPPQPPPAQRPPTRPTVLNEPLPGAAVVPRPQDTDLSEPVVERSNLPANAPPPGVVVPTPAPDPVEPPDTPPQPLPQPVPQPVPQGETGAPLEPSADRPRGPVRIPSVREARARSR